MTRKEDGLEYHTNKLGHAYCHTNSITPDDFSNNDLLVGGSNLGEGKMKTQGTGLMGKGINSRYRFQR